MRLPPSRAASCRHLLSPNGAAHSRLGHRPRCWRSIAVALKGRPIYRAGSPITVIGKIRGVRTVPPVSLSSVRNGGEGRGEEALHNGGIVGKSGAPLSPALSPFVPHGARETDAPLTTTVPARTFATIDRTPLQGWVPFDYPTQGSAALCPGLVWSRPVGANQIPMPRRTDRLPVPFVGSFEKPKSQI